MPWDGTELWVGEINTEELGLVKRVAGGVDESIFQPEWSQDGILHFVSDRTGWWNLYRWRKGHIEPINGMEVEFGAPQWFFGMSTYAFESSDNIICTITRREPGSLPAWILLHKKLQPIKTPYTDISYLRARNGQVVFVAGSPTETTSIVQLDLHSGKMLSLFAARPICH